MFNNSKNIQGQDIKLVLGSRVLSEGTSLYNVKQVHILDTHYHLGRVEQVIGRAIRVCRHYDIMSKNNPFPEVDVYKYVVSADNVAVYQTNNWNIL